MTDETIEEFLARGGKIKKLPPGRASANDAINDELLDVFMLQHPSDDVKLSDEEFKDLRNRRKFRMDLPTRQRDLGYDQFFGSHNYMVPLDGPPIGDDTYYYTGVYGWQKVTLPDMDGRRIGRRSL